MLGIKVSIKVHANYVQTCVRFWGKTGVEYTEYALFGASVPSKVLAQPDAEALQSLCRRLRSDPETYNVRAKYIEDFDGYFSLVMDFPDVADLSIFDVLEARIIEDKRGGRDVVEALKDPQLKRVVLTNFFGAVAEKDVAKMTGLLNIL